MSNHASADSNAPVKAIFHNQLSIPVDLFWIDFQGKEQHYAFLLPGVILEQSTFATHSWIVRDSISKNEIRIFTADESSEQEFKIRAQSVASDTATQVTFINSLPVPIAIYWIDFLGSEKHYATLRPGQVLEQKTFDTHPWVVREATSGFPLGFILATATLQTYEVRAEKLRSLPGGSPVNVVFKNVTPFELDMFWINFEGSEVHSGSLQPGESVTWSTASTHPWTLKDRSTGALIDCFIGSGTGLQFHEIFPVSYQGHPQTSIEFHNETPLEVDLLVVLNGVEKRYKGLSPHETFVQKTYAAMTWVVRDANSSHLLQMATASEKPSVCTISAQGLRSVGGTPGVEITLRNATPFAVEFSWIDFEGREVPYGLLKPGDSYTQLTGANHVWRFRERDTRTEVGLYIASGEPVQRSDIRVRSSHARFPTTIQFINKTSLQAEILWLDYEGIEKSYAILRPGGETAFQTFLTHPWIVRDVRSRQIIEQAFGEIHAQTILITDEDLLPRGEEYPVTVTFQNSLPFVVDLFKFDSQGKEVHAGTLVPGTSVTHATFAGHPWRLRQLLSGTEVALFLAGLETTQRCEVQLKSAASEIQCEIEFLNESPLEVELFWIDFEGKEISYGSLVPRDSAKIPSFVTHPWIVRDKRSREGIAYTVGTNTAQLVRITGQHVRSRSSSVATSVNFINDSGIPVDLQWIDYEGKGTPYATLQPGQSIMQGTFFGHPWRMVRSGTERQVDLFVPANTAEQTYRIKNALIRRGMRASGMLYEGEVALFEHENYQGQSWILFSDFENFLDVPGFNDQVSSIKLGPSTTLTVYQDTHYQGVNDVFTMDLPNLRNTDVKDNQISSLQLFTVAPPERSVLSSTATLSQEYETDSTGGLIMKPDGSPKTFSSYRSIVSFAPEVASVDVWATEETSIEVRGVPYQIDAVRSARLKPDSTGKLMIQMRANSLGTPALQFRTNTMRVNERVYVFPDQDANRKIVNLKPGEIYANRDKLDVKGGLSEKDCEEIQSAIQNLSKAVGQVGGAVGRKKRLVVADNMEYTTWALDLGAARDGLARYRPLSQAEAAELTAGAVLIDDRLAQGWFDDAWGFVNRVVIEPVAHTTVNVANTISQEVIKPAVTAVDQHVITPVVQTAEQVATLAKEQLLQPVAVAVVKAVDKVVDVVQQGVELVKTGAEAALKITIQLAEESKAFIIDTARKAAVFIEKIVEQVCESVQKFVEYLESVFNWGDMLKTHDLLIDLLGRAYNKADIGIAALRNHIKHALAHVREETIASIDEQLKSLGAKTNVQANGGKTMADFTQGDDQSDWVNSKFGENASGMNVSANLPNLDHLTTTIETLLSRIQNQVEQDGPVIMQALEDALSSLGKAVEDPSNFLRHVLAGLLQVVKAGLVAGFGLVEAIVDLLLDVVQVIIAAFWTFVNAKLDIPFLSDLYRWMTQGRSLSLISLACLLCAVPTTIICKLVLGTSPDSALSSITLGAEEGPVHPNFIAITGAVCLLGTQIGSTISGIAGEGLSPEQQNTVNAVTLILNVLSQVLGVGTMISGMFSHDNKTDWPYMSDYLSSIAWWLTWVTVASDCIFWKLTGQVKGSARANREKLAAGVSLALGAVAIGMASGSVEHARQRIARAKQILSSPERTAYSDASTPKLSELQDWANEDGKKHNLTAAAAILGVLPNVLNPMGQLVKHPKAKIALFGVATACVVSNFGVVIADVAE